jgi:hypothetical protein
VGQEGRRHARARRRQVARSGNGRRVAEARREDNECACANAG